MGVDKRKESLNWKVKRQDGSRLEPANVDVLRQWAASGEIGPDDLVINDELADWMRASEIPELKNLFQVRSAVPGESVPSEEERISPRAREAEVEVPDCAFHPGRTSSEICVGCGKFICEECRQRYEHKVYCRRCMAEKNAGVEPGAPVGLDAVSDGRETTLAKVPMSGFAIASVVFSGIAILAVAAMLVPGISIATVPVAGFCSFLAALLGGLALNRIRMSAGFLQGRGVALAGLVFGCFILGVSLIFAYAFTVQAKRGPAQEGARRTGLERWIPAGRRSGLPRSARRQSQEGFLKRPVEEDENAAKRLLEEASMLLSQGKLEEALTQCKSLVSYYPETETAELVRQRMPVMEKALQQQRAEREERAQEIETAAREKYELALNLYSEGDRIASLELFRSIVDDYPEASVAKRARTEWSRIKQEIANEESARRQAEASSLAADAEQKMEAEQYADAAVLYRRIIAAYPETPTASDIKPKLEQVELIISDPSELAFYKIQEELETRTYEEAIVQLEGFLERYPDSARTEQVTELLAENQRKKGEADTLYNFGRAYFEDGKYRSALGRYEKLIAEYPRSRWIPRAKQENREALKRLQQ